MIRLLRCFVVAALALLRRRHAQAHPHVWVTMKSELVYGADGSATGVRHAWTFDDMFSTFATQGLESKEKGKFTREELAPLAEVNVDLAEGIRLLHGRARQRQEGRPRTRRSTTISNSTTGCSRCTSPCRSRRR